MKILVVKMSYCSLLLHECSVSMKFSEIMNKYSKIVGLTAKYSTVNQCDTLMNHAVNAANWIIYKYVQLTREIPKLTLT